MNRKALFFYAALSIAITAGLGVIAASTVLHDVVEGLAMVDGRFAPPRWLPVLVITGAASIAVGIMSILTLRLMRELKARNATLRKAESERLSFAADAAHELRTPLAILRVHADSLDDSETTRQLRSDVDHITRIVEQVLAKSRVEALEIKPGETVDLAQVCRDMAAYVAPLVIKEGRDIELTGADAPCVVPGNAFGVEQALRNLVENAMKYSARGSTITLAVEPGEQDCRLKVIDQGRGVAPEDRDVIFQRFHRADRRGSGSGLGLSIVQRVAESHGGEASVEDAPGGGAVFILRFPR